MPTWRPRNRANASSLRALKGVPLTTTSPLSGRSSPAMTMRSVDFPEPDGPIRPSASPDATRRLMSLRIWTRAAPEPSERLTSEMEMLSGEMPDKDEGFVRLSMVSSYGTSGSAVERLAPTFRSSRALAAALLRELRKVMGTSKLMIPVSLFDLKSPGRIRRSRCSDFRSAALLSTFKHMLVSCLLLAIVEPALAQSSAAAGSAPVKMVVLGDSLSAGYGLPGSDAFPAKLQKALKANGIAVDMTNAGVSGDTASGGRDRLDWSVPQGTQAVIVELGAHDALRGTDPAVTRAALTDILKRPKARVSAVLLCGMLAPPKYGREYAARFNAIYPALASSFEVPLYR